MIKRIYETDNFDVPEWKKETEWKVGDKAIYHYVPGISRKDLKKYDGQVVEIDQVGQSVSVLVPCYMKFADGKRCGFFIKTTSLEKITDAKVKFDKLKKIYGEGKWKIWYNNLMGYFFATNGVSTLTGVSKANIESQIAQHHGQDVPDEYKVKF